MHGSRVNPLVGLVRTLQIIIVAITLGCVFFFGIALLAGGSPIGFDELPPITLIALVFTAVIAVARCIVPSVFVARARRKIREGTWNFQPKTGAKIPSDPDNPKTIIYKLAQVFMARTILAAAMLEGAAFFVLVTYLVARSPWSLIAAFVLIIALFAHIPTPNRVSLWIQDQMKLLDEERTLSPPS